MHRTICAPEVHANLVKHKCNYKHTSLNMSFQAQNIAIIAYLITYNHSQELHWSSKVC